MSSIPVPPEVVGLISKDNADEWRGFPPLTIATHTAHLHGELTCLATDGVKVIATREDGFLIDTFLASLRFLKPISLDFKPKAVRSKVSKVHKLFMRKFKVTKEELQSLLEAIELA